MHPAFHLRWMSQQMAQTKPSYVCLPDTSARQRGHSVKTYWALLHSVTLEERTSMKLSCRCLMKEELMSRMLCPSLLGKEKGAVQRLKEEHSDLLTYYCIIHQSVLCASLGEEYSDVMELLWSLWTTWEHPLPFSTIFCGHSWLRWELIQCFTCTVLVWVGQWCFIMWWPHRDCTHKNIASEP